MLYKVWSKYGKEHLWTYESFKEQTKAKTIDYKLNGRIIEYIVYEVPEEIEKKVFKEYGFNHKVLKDLKEVK